MASMQIAVGIWGVLLLAVPALVFTRGRSAGTMTALVVLLVGTLLSASGGVAGLKPQRAVRAAGLMTAGGAVLTVSALVLLIVSFTINNVNWYFPLGAMFLTLGLLSSIASRRFRRMAMTSSRRVEDSKRP